MITIPSPNRNPVITGFDTRSETAPKRSRPPSASTTATTSASAADSAMKRSMSPPASGPTVAADTADVAVVALTMSWREVPMKPYASIATGAAISPASGGRPAICAYATACGVTTLQITIPAMTSGRSHARSYDRSHDGTTVTRRLRTPSPSRP